MGRDPRTGYHAWNTALAEHFVGDAAAGRPVYLDVEDDLLASVGQRLGGGMGTREFCAAVAATLNWESGRLFKPHRDAYVQWESEAGESPPPTIALLCFFTVAAEQMRADGRLAVHNYYGRLCEIVGIETGDSRAEAKIRRDYQAEAPGLWSGLNRWLLEADGRHGIPTAYSFDRRVNVGPPISQALVRAGDRERLRDMFTAFGLRPHQRVARHDMAELLETWAPDASGALQRLIEADALREHVADIAIVELAAWDGRRARGSAADTADMHDGALVLTARYRQGMWRQLGLDLAVFGEVDGTWSVPMDATGPSAEAARAAGEFVAAHPADGWTTFSTDAEISMPDVLKGTLVLRANEVELQRHARRVVVFAADNVLPWLVEQPRAELWEDTWLLVHDAVVPGVDARLGGFARPGFRRFAADDLPGVPEGWWFYEGVQLVTSPSDIANSPEDLLPLVPLSDSQVAVAGGHPLVGHGAFHVSAPPEVRVTAAGELSADLNLVAEFVYGGTAETRSLGVVSGGGVFDLTGLGLTEGDYRLLLTDTAGRTLTSATFRLRGAEHPLMPSPWLAEWCGHVVGPSGVEWFGTRAPDPPVTDWVRGAETRGAADVAGGTDVTGGAISVPYALGAHASALEDDGGPVQASRARTDTDMPCPPHHIVIPPTDSQGRMPRRYKGYCRICGLEKWYRRGGGRRHRRHPGTDVAPTPSFVLPPLPSVSEAPPGDADMLLDAVSTVGAGSWSSFERLVRWVDNAPWASAEYARTFSSLGHIEAVYGGPGRLSHWAVLPPALVLTVASGTSAFLTGVRRPALLALLEETAAILDAQVTRATQPEAPQLVRVNAHSPDDLEVIAAELGLLLLPAPPPALLRIFPPIAQLATAVPITAPPGGAQVSRYDPTSGRWTDVPNISGVGAYRVATRPTRYVVTHRGRWFEVDNLLAKYVAAAQQGVASIAYDATTRTLFVPLGARLPGLFERAVVLCSGRAPVETGDGRIAYGDVPADIAAALWSKLRSQAWEES